MFVEIEYVFITILFTVFFVLFTIFISYLIAIIWKIAAKPKNNPEEFLEYLTKKEPPKKRKKRIVFVGDSLTHGNMSVNFVEMVKNELGTKKYRFINAGINAELSYHVLQRIKPIITCEPDFIIILIGTNDAKQELIVEHDDSSLVQLSLPQEPTHAWFKSNLQKIIKKFQNETEAKIAICSIPPIGETIEHEGFKQSIKYSKTIKKIAKEMNVAYLPVNEEMIQYLQKHPSNPKYPLEKRLVQLAAVKYYFAGKSFDEISRENGFTLMIDHIHLNTKGAKIVANLVINFLREKALN